MFVSACLTGHVVRWMQVDPSKTVLLVTEAPFAPPVVTAMAVEMIFEEYGFIGCIKVRHGSDHI